MGTMTKTVAEVVVTPSIPPLPGASPVPFRMYATPPPRGFTYRQLSGGRPNNAASFNAWSQLMEAPTEYVSVAAGFKYMTLVQVYDEHNGVVPNGSRPVFSGGGDLVGYDVPVMKSQALPAAWYGPISHMTFVHFPGVATAPNGYPLVPGPVSGTFTVPTATGQLKIERVYVKDARGVWLPQSVVDPPNCKTSGSCKVVMFADFAGRPARVRVPAVVQRDFQEGWNAGGESIDRLDGDVRVVFTAAAIAAAAVGFAPEAARAIGDYRNLTHAWYFDNDPATGQRRAAPMEEGRVVGPYLPCHADTEFQIERLDGIVTYRHNGADLQSSAALSGGAVLVGGCLYRGGDAVG